MDMAPEAIDTCDTNRLVQQPRFRETAKTGQTMSEFLDASID